MPFKKVLIALDGSKYSQIASAYGFWLSSCLDAKLSMQHIVDPRVADMLIAPEFAEELGLAAASEISDKVFAALRKIGRLILNVVNNEAQGRNIAVHTHLDEGHVVEEILKRAAEHDLVILGHKGMGKHPVIAELALGTVAERVAVGSKKPVLIAVSSIESMNEILVAFDGSEPALGALLMAEQLAKQGRTRLKACIVIPDESHRAEAELTVEQGRKLLREFWPEEVFSIITGVATDELPTLAQKNQSLLVIGAYGFRNPELNVMGRTVTSIVRRSACSLLIYR